mgnify:CR=1 FL=1
MKRALAAILPLTVCACSLTRPPLPPPELPDPELSAETPGEAYGALMRCAESWGRSQAPGPASATEVADAVRAACARELERLRIAAHLEALGGPLGRYQPRALIERSIAKVLDGAAEDARRHALRAVIAARTTPEAP